MSSLTTKTTKSRSAASPKPAAKSVKKTVKNSLKKETKKLVSIKKAPKAKATVTAKVKKPVLSTKKTAKAPAKVSPKPSQPKKVAAKKVVAKGVKVSKKKAASKKTVISIAPPKPPMSRANLAAVHAFEQGLKSFNRHDYSGARQAFERILDKFSDQTEVVTGVRKYLAICEQKLARTPSAPKNPDALYDQGVYELNRANVREAAQLLERALKAQPKGDHIFYSLAAAYARLSENKKALDVLRQAIQLQPVHRSRARGDVDFVSLHDNEEFQQMTGFGIGFFDE